MKRRSFVLALGGLTFLHAGEVSAQTPQAGAAVLARLTEAPVADAAGVAYRSYIALIPTQEATRATPELLSALAHLSGVFAAAPEMAPSAAMFVGDPLTGAFDAALTDAAIVELNARREFGLDRSHGAILLISRGPLSEAAGLSAFVSDRNDPAEIAAALQAVTFPTTAPTKGPPLPEDPWAHWWPPHIPGFSPPKPGRP